MSGPFARAFAPALIFVGLIVSLISSLGAPLIPTIAKDLGASLSTTQWSLTATLLVAAITSPLIGRLGDGRHRKRVMLVCLGSVTLGGLLAALAQDVGVLIFGRALQGLGLAVMPLTMAAAREHLGEQRAPAVIAKLSVTAAVGVGLGYPATGFIAEHGGASAAFWFGVAVSGMAFIVAAVVVPGSTREREEGRVDFVGAGLVGAGLLMLLLALEKSSDWGWGATSTLVLLAGGVLLLCAWVRYELWFPSPLVDLRLVRHRAVFSANASAFTLGIGMYLSIVLVTQLIQTPASTGYGFGATVFVAGLALLPLSAMSFVSSSFMPRVQRRLGTRAVVPIGAVVLGCACLYFALTAQHLYQAFVMFGIAGAGLGFTFAAMPQLIVAAVPQRETSSSMSLYQVSRFVGFSVGSSLSVTLLRAFGGPDHAAYRDAFLVATAITFATALLSWFATGPVATDDVDERAEFEEGVIGAAGLEVLEEVTRVRLRADATETRCE